MNIKTPTKILIGLLALIHLGRLFFDSQDWLIINGCFLGSATFQDNEYYRLITGAFLHGNLLHLGFNSWCLWQFLPYMSRIHGHTNAHLVLWSSVVGGGLLSGLMNLDQRAIGISGGVFGIVGLYFLTLKFFQRFNKSAELDSAIKEIIFLIGINLYLGFTTPSIDNAGHIGGLVTGLIVGTLLIKKRGF